MYSTIQMAKMPAIIATIAAIPPFATKEVAADVVVVVGAEELAAEIVGELAELADPLPLEALEEPEALDAEEPDAEDNPPLPLAELAGVVNETELGNGVVPEALILAARHIAFCAASAACKSPGQCVLIQRPASTWN